jgi:hypothetical protein
MGTVRTNHEVKVDFNLPCPGSIRGFSSLNLEPGFALAEVGPCQLMVEVERDVRHLLQYIK